jgi:hypothetical protein
MSKLVIPIDVSQITDTDRGQQKVKVAAKVGEKIVSDVVSVKDGKAEITLDVDPKQAVTLAVGPDNVSDQEIFNFQTLTATVNPAQWAGKPSLKLPAFIVTRPWWDLWLRWCRTFVIQGRFLVHKLRPLTLISFGGGCRSRRLVPLWSRMRTDTSPSSSDGVVVGGHGGGGSYAVGLLSRCSLTRLTRYSNFGLN